MQDNDTFVSSDKVSGSSVNSEGIRFASYKAQLLAAIDADDFEVFADALGEIEAIHQHTENENLRRKAYQVMVKAGRSEVGPLAVDYMREVGGFEMPPTWDAPNSSPS